MAVSGREEEHKMEENKREEFLKQYWTAILGQQADQLPLFFKEDACIRWHNTREQFTVAEFIRANCEYPGEWTGEAERLETVGECSIMAVHVHTKDGSLSFHVVSFIRMKDDLISELDEYWGDDGPVPGWRKEKQIGILFP